MRIGGYGVSCTAKLWVVAFTPKVVKALTMWDTSLFISVLLANYWQYMKETLVPLYNLELTVEEKPVMNVDDLYLVLHHHWIMDTTPYPDGWQILQLAFLLASAYTASRPGALV